ncbi:DUF3237 domain-containing protein [Ketobacter sp. MCCC 1A13808]|uniref:DUF3237 domain-containing protein n=1 Tax=Ketobacter sp. MCCC 1A13808 TaxID=2602738 RepID=UPI0012EBDFB5|nr:DUF3237 family protein [Ketobacter sp. MCCC 1A13808]MVF12949.1 DUF3237 domain-containing protein [Ketobacter sp. MCCC 1A13808]
MKYQKLFFLPLLTNTLLLSLSVQADVVYQPSFSNGNDGFSLEGRSSINGGGIRLQGGSTIARVQSPVIEVSDYQHLVLSYNRATNRLDPGEAAAAQISVNGEDFATLESVRDENGKVTFPITHSADINTVALRFSLNASSFFESYNVSDITLEGDAENCGEECDPVEPPESGNHKVIVPDSSWTCSAPEGIPDPTTGTLVFKTTLSAGNVRDIGITPYGQRKVTPVNGGQIQAADFGSPPLSGDVQDNALDVDLHLPSGAVEHESRYVITTSDRTLIYMRNCGVADADNIRFVADFEAPDNSRYAWLNNGRYIGVRKVNGKSIDLEVYTDASTRPNDRRVQVLADNDVRQQTWECPTLSPAVSAGDSVMTLRVGIAGFQSVGDSKYGSRRIIGITGGSFSGTINGNVNPGGADYQLTRNGELSLEARYTIEPENGEPILVRNCGDYGSGDLTWPLFEAATDSEYNWLNDTDFVGTITPGLGRVTIEVYDRQ